MQFFSLIITIVEMFGLGVTISLAEQGFHVTAWIVALATFAIAYVDGAISVRRD